MIKIANVYFMEMYGKIESSFENLSWTNLIELVQCLALAITAYLKNRYVVAKQL